MAELFQEVPGKMTRPFDPKREKKINAKKGIRRRDSKQRGFLKRVAARRFRHTMPLDEEGILFALPRQKIGDSWEF